MALEEWETTPEGKLCAPPLTAWEMAFAEDLALVRLRYAPSEDRLKSAEAVQIGMSASQARQLAEDLVRMADEIERG